ncbi:hypothetical protein SYN63AY4M2_01015 [Synechococcus sp. 63AY4M2]|nr:hypothetical protein SYN63AY4M2_01015 [Synechococcus sp. 63AY4M2]PIK89711.1 hypothetical protein SYN65AY6A5_04705 [Synechococcus sp. 65AY6A5]PIK93272.1 hypothetical protein SYN65AY6LI_11880 [Synechococcus sp. 65AY6Li]PIK96350.1 hypothetical protein SYN60AY4M2_01435 [Synechococcus sp. 60AY4M2]PIK99192.1 hypothetical protein SYN63AY4M1_12385 [Synechococcus sp. 63AY4M1]PIL02364.1 hypothetical protein SYN65AY640_01635 [Synechococcus sp. 65AY640]
MEAICPKGRKEIWPAPTHPLLPGEVPAGNTDLCQLWILQQGFLPELGKP